MENTNITIISGVQTYLDEKGTAWLNAEDVARGLGFTRDKDGTEYVMWDRVNKYLDDFGFSTQVRKDSYIPENMFYRLAVNYSDLKKSELVHTNTGLYQTRDSIANALS